MSVSECESVCDVSVSVSVSVCMSEWDGGVQKHAGVTCEEQPVGRFLIPLS